MKTSRFLIDLPFRLVFAFLGFTFLGWIGWVGLVLIGLRFFHVISWPWWVAALPLIYGVLYCLYMTIDGALYRAGRKDIGGYARFTASDEQTAHAEFEQVLRIIREGPERIAPTIDACCEDPNQKAFAQALLDASLEDYFLLQLAMFANKKVNAYVTIKRWKNAGLKLPAEGTPEFYPYGDSEKTAPPQQPRQLGSEISEVPQEELDREVGIKPDELLGLFQISLQINDGIDDWLNPPSGVAPKSGADICDNLIAQLPKLSSGLTTLGDRIQEIWDRAGFDYKIIDSKIPCDQIRVKCGELLSLAQTRTLISSELDQWVHPERIVLKEGKDKLGHLIGRMDIFTQTLKSIQATLGVIKERNLGESAE